MPADRSHRQYTDLEISTPLEIESLYSAIGKLSQRGGLTRPVATREIQDEIGWLAAAHPDWLRPHLPRLLRDHPEEMHLAFDSLCALLDGADAEVIDLLLRRHAADPRDHRTRSFLAATRHPAAMETLADRARSDEAVAQDLRRDGFEVPAHGPAVARFHSQRYALIFGSAPGRLDGPHVAGLPLSAVAAPEEADISFHYVSVTPALIAGLPTWDSGRLHLVSVRELTGWVLWARPDAEGRYQILAVDRDEDWGDLNDTLTEYLDLDQPTGAVDVRRFDDSLTYGNGHIFWTPEVLGVAGGPPMGLAPVPECRLCGRVMFHVGYVEPAVRSYGNGFRHLFMCEDCQASACMATLHN